MSYEDDVPMIGDRAMIFDRQGKPCTRGFWSEKMSDDDYRVVALDTIHGVRVSTVWLGLDHGMSFLSGKDTPPVIFETMLFSSDSCRMFRRYSTEEQAKTGHASAVASVRATEV